MIRVPKNDVETLLFLVGGCAFFGGQPLVRAYILNDFTPGEFRSPGAAAAASFQDRSAIALLLGLVTTIALAWTRDAPFLFILRPAS